MLKIRAKRPKLAAAPILDEKGSILASYEAIQRQWIHQSSEEFAGKCATDVSRTFATTISGTRRVLS